MITLHLLQLLEDNGFGTIDTDLHWENQPLTSQGDAAEGIWIVSRGGEASRIDTGYQAFDIFARFGNKLRTHQDLEAILQFLQEQYSELCDLPTVPPYSDTLYTNCRIQPTSTIEHAGVDEQGMVVMLISGEVRFDVDAGSS